MLRIVQRLFSAFPGGGPGLGLLVLRTAIGLTAIAQGAAAIAGAGSPLLRGAIVGGLAIASGAAILIGFLTPGTGIALGLVLPFFWIPSRADGLFLDRVTGLLAAAVTIAIALIGPGAFSVDARLFGRREILVPHPSSQPSARS